MTYADKVIGQLQRWAEDDDDMAQAAREMLQLDLQSGPYIALPEAKGYTAHHCALSIVLQSDVWDEEYAVTRLDFLASRYPE